jgi:uncharacterized OB-fold protein
MNKSEVKEKFDFKEKSSTGWICPKCGRVLAPNVITCPCTQSKQENVQASINWIKD